MAENANRGLRIAECRIRNPQFEIRTLAASLPVRLLTLIFCFVLIAVAPAQTFDQQPSIGPKLPPVRCTFAPTKDAVRWKLTPTAQSTPGTPIAGKEESIDPVALAKDSNQQQPVEPKLPSVRCKIVPTKDAVRWQSTPAIQSTPGTPISEKDRPDSSSHLAILNANLLNGDSNSGMPSANCEPDNAKSEIRNPKLSGQTSTDKSQTPNVQRQTPNAERQLVQSLVDIGTANGERQTPNAERQTSTDAWFQIPTETPESTDIQEAVLTTSVNDNTKVEPQPLVQVLANLARQAQRNFVDPGILSTETITYNFADSDLDPWEAFTRIVEARGYRIIYRGDIVCLAQNEQDSPNPGNAYKVKAEIWLDQSAKPGAHQSSLAIEVADTNVAPNNKPRAVRSLQPGSNTEISLIDIQSERGDSTVRLTVNPVLLPNGNLQADLGIDNAAPSPNGHKSGAIRRTTKFTIELTPTKQAIEIDGLLMPNNDPNTGKQAWFQRLFRKRAPANGAARMVVRLTVEPAAGSQTPIHTDSPVRIPRSDSGKTGIALAPGQVRGTPELTSIQTLKH
jgi:hypothetical protein